MTTEYLTIRELGAYLGMSHRTLEGWKRKCFLPPHFELASRIHKWRRSDIDAWMLLKQRGLLDDWLELRRELGEHAAWSVALNRLEIA